MPARSYRRILGFTVLMSSFVAVSAWAAAASSPAADAAKKGMTMWELMRSGGWTMVMLTLLSVATVASILYHFLHVRAEKLVPQDMIENLMSLLERKEFDKAATVCRQQENLVSSIALKGISKIGKGKAVVEEAVMYEGRARIETLWQNLTYLGDMAVIAPMVGLLGTIWGMIDAFNYFKAGTLNPTLLTSGLAKAMINTAVGLVVAVPALVFYSYFRGRLTRITSTTESAAAEIAQLIGSGK